MANLEVTTFFILQLYIIFKTDKSSKYLHHKSL